MNTLDLLRQYESRNVTFMEADASWPIVWARAKGVHVWDEAGRKYLDLTAAFGVASAGHANPRVVRAGQQQMATLLHAMGDVHTHALKAKLARELNRIGNTTQFNGANLLRGDAATDAAAAVGNKSVTLQIGANANQTLAVSIADSRGGKLGVAFGTAVAATQLPGDASYSEAAFGLDVSTQAAATTALGAIDAAITTVSGQRADLGAAQNRLQHTVNALSVASENASAAESRIRDTDMAKEMTSFTRSQILQQAGVSMLAQANSAPQSVLKLLG